MSEPTIPAAAQFWEALLQLRAEVAELRAALDGHRARERERYTELVAQIADLARQVGGCADARQQYTDHIMQLHSVMRQWYHTLIDLHRTILQVRDAVEPQGGVVFLPPPEPAAARERGEPR